MNNVAKTIQWCDKTWNPIKGLCTIGCSYCYARKFYKRFGWNPKIRLDEKVLQEPLKLKKSSRIFVCSTIDIGCSEIKREWKYRITSTAKKCPQHTFIFLSKYPHQAYSGVYFPENCWLGHTLDGINEYITFQYKRKFINYEPLQNENQAYYCKYALYDAKWVIVGGMTPKPIHKKEWVDEIIKIAKSYNIPIFLKQNLQYPEKIQEFPKEIK